MAEFFADDFTGTGDLSTHTPDLGAAGAWAAPPYGTEAVLTGSGGVTRSSDSPAPQTVLLTLGPARGTYLAEFSMTVANSTVRPGARDLALGFQVFAGYCNVSMDLSWSAETSDDALSFNARSDLQSVEGDLHITDGATYTGTLAVHNGYQILKFLGYTFVNRAEIFTTDDQASVRLTLGQYITLNYFTLAEFPDGIDLLPLPPTVESSGGPSPIVIGSATASLSPAAATVAIIGRFSAGEQAAVLSAPPPQMQVFGGTNAKLIAPGASVEATGTTTFAAYAKLMAPHPSLSAGVTTTLLGNAPLKAPIAKLIGYGGAVCAVAVSGHPRIVASATTGIFAGAALVCPLFQLEATSTLHAGAKVNLLAPSPELGRTAQAWLLAPGAQLTAVGTAVVAVSYEAYALNLNHTPRGAGQDANDELTRFTNYPFDRIVRYKNSYFGMNSTGLYLLEGTTDGGAPIPWSYRTHLTDFKSVQLKNIDTIYFGGRMGPASSVYVYVGETGTQSYRFTTPRGAAAQNYRQTTGKGMRSRYYGVGAAGEGEMTLDTLTINVANLARKV